MRRLLIVSLLTTTGLLAPRDGRADAQEDGRAAFRAGVALLQDPDGAKYDEAAPLFRRAYNLTKTWKVLGNLGLCLMKSERSGEAIWAYERYLAEGDKQIDPAERAQVERDLGTLRQQKATVQISAKGISALRVRDDRVKPSGQHVLNTYEESTGRASLDVVPGEHVFTLLDGDKEAARWTIRLQPGMTAAHDFLDNSNESRSSSAGQGKSSAPLLIAGGVTLALAAATTVTGVLALGRRSDYHEINGKPGHTEAELSVARDEAATMSTISSVLFGASVAGAAVTTFFLLKPGDAQTRSGTVAPWVGPNSAGLLLRGSL